MPKQKFSNDGKRRLILKKKGNFINIDLTFGGIV